MHAMVKPYAAQTRLAGRLYYHGFRDEQTVPHVLRHDGKPLDLRRDWQNKSELPEWGYMGSGPAQLALAILGDCTGKKGAERLFQHFKMDVIQDIDLDDWIIFKEDVQRWLQEARAKYPEP